MQSELQESASHGYRFKTVMGGEATFGGSEVVVVMERSYTDIEPGRYEYELLAANRTSTMEREIQEAADRGFHFCGQTVFSTTFGGDEVVVILERDTQEPSGSSWDYRLLGTNKTSTMQKELLEAADNGFEVLGMTLGATTFGGQELVIIIRKRWER